MINSEALSAVITAYKEYFPGHWVKEKYKWEAVKHFQSHWDLSAPNFASMLETATEKTDNLLTSGYFYPRTMILNFAKADPEAVRSMFQNLYDETKSLSSRVDWFQSESDRLRIKYDDGHWKQHYQNTNAISTYLWLRYPDRYYIYKYSECLAVAKQLESDFIPKKELSAANMIRGFQLYDEICEELIKDPALDQMFRNVVTGAMDPDTERKTMTIDVGFFISRFYSRETSGDAGEWFPADYSPNLSVDQWKKLLSDDAVFSVSSLEIMKRLKDYGGKATCSQLAVKYGKDKNFYKTGSAFLAKRVADKTGCPLMQDAEGNTRWWPILYMGKKADGEIQGSFIWKLREELNAALDQTDLSDISLYAGTEPAFWKISHGPDFFSDSELRALEEKRVIVVNKDTKPKGTCKVSQGDSFMLSMKKGDYFYLCYGNSIQLLGRISSDEATENPEKQGGWYQREYTLIAKSKDTSPYTGAQKWWTPNDNSTCIEVREGDRAQWEALILQPYFGLTLPALLEDSHDVRGYWWLNANPKIWSFAGLAVGDVQSYTLYNDNGNKRRIFQNFLNAKAGDLVIGYESYPVKQVVALAVIAQENDGKNLYFKKVESLTSPVDYQVLKSCPELERMEYFTNSQGSLFRITKGEYDFILDLIRESNPVSSAAKEKELYDRSAFLSEVYLPPDSFNTLVSLLRHKKNLILQGAPGVGKTFAAKRLAYAMMGEKDDSRIEFIQFHQNYSYEDFVMGYRPQADGFQLTNGIFYRFCVQAANHPEKDYFFIIDEINRGNLSKIFGELLMLIEKDYRGTKATLAYSGTPFSVPENLYLIGMMNTADRSLAMIDYALRRRFGFFELEPGFHSEGFQTYREKLDSEMFDVLIQRIDALNREITADRSLGKGFCIGHSYFCGQSECTEEWMREVVFYDIFPMLEEYWFDEPEKLQQWKNTLSGVFHD
ncbi:EVE domain-containing protein [Cuneatibacter sp. NSJ-177]|uniref:AAA family ATPase n=1 Tax=Cuneatibacter sp. NSJ-177 TaxID=2931401 RepID=UPI001FD17FD3|nr:AAA family ATPase [Cuneatibacter sp. NSJ-177]MCJ7834971.1 EVE domain-containing protein [Cuneatibacter sp. NSJ-177]